MTINLMDFKEVLNYLDSYNSRAMLGGLYDIYCDGVDRSNI